MQKNHSTPSPQRPRRLANLLYPHERIRLGVKGTLKISTFLAASCFTLGAAGYFLLKMIMHGDGVFGSLYRMYLYHWKHPLQYIGLMSICYSAVATISISLRGDLVGKYPRKTIPLIIVLSILAASPAGGVLWVIHDMQAGYFPKNSQFWEAIESGAMGGIILGWLIILLSVPYNILGLILGYLVTWYGYKMTLRNRSNRELRTELSEKDGVADRMGKRHLP